MAPSHDDLSEVVMNYFANHGRLPEGVQQLDKGVIEELIDAIPSHKKKLITELQRLING